VESNKLLNEERDDLYCSPKIFRTVKLGVMRWARHVERMWFSRGVYRVLVGKPEGKKPRGRPKRRWVNNNKMNL
jgi:hypothetical protein